jgi:hypothetical protein
MGHYVVLRYYRSRLIRVQWCWSDQQLQFVTQRCILNLNVQVNTRS